MTDIIETGVSIPDDPDDMERYVVQPDIVGEPVDLPAVKTTFADITSRADNRKPIVPMWLQARDGRAAAARLARTLAWYYPAYHASRSPFYVARILRWSPVGFFVLLKRSWRWAYDMEAWGARQHAVIHNHYDEYAGYQRLADKHRRGRVPIFFVVLAALVAAVLVVYHLASPLQQAAVLVLAVTILARAGRPVDQPILDRVTQGRRFVRLTGEMVRNALVAAGVPGLREPSQLQFPMGIRGEGPGWLARVNLPVGVTAVKVLEKREELSSAMRLPIDQIWPEAGPDHAGQLDLWVGEKPSSQMGQPKWALAAPNARTSVFEPAPFATDARQRPIYTTLFETNYLVGGAPGSGKSYGARTLATIAMLDPTCELKMAEFKGTGDFLDMEPLCSTYVVGVDDDAFEKGAGIIAWALAECERRGKRILAAKKRGEAPLGKITPELARKKGSGLHPVFILLDEVHELFLYDPAAAKQAERAIKRGRALGIIICLATQIPDKDSVPPNITRCVTIRWCLAVGGQVENDMILGTGAYKRGLSATAYRPKYDAGWGVTVGLEKSGAVRSYFPSPEATAAILARAAELRGDVVGTDDVERAPKRDTLADVLRVFAYAGRTSLQWAQLAELMSEHLPEAYGEITQGMVSAAVRAEGVASKDVNLGRDPESGKDDVKKGCYLADVREVVARRELAGSGPAGVLGAS